jgi:excisionase family DNA binding protein
MSTRVEAAVPRLRQLAGGELSDQASPDFRDGETILLELRVASPSKQVESTGDTLLVRVEEAARLLSISRAALYPLLSREIPVVRIGRSVRVPRVELEKYIAGRLEDANRWS